MKRYIFAVILFLTACAAPQSAPMVDDPNISLAIAQAQLTGTAQAWMIQQQGWTATAQSWTPTPSPMPTFTPVPSFTPLPTITSVPTANIQATMEWANAEAEQERVNMELERERRTNQFRGWLPYFVAVVVLGLAGFLGFVSVRRMAFIPNPIHEGTGKPMPMLDVIDGIVSDIDRAPNGMSIMSRKYANALPPITADRQDKVTATAQAMDGQSRTKVTNAALIKFMKEHSLDKPSAPVPAAAYLPAASSITDEDINLPLPSWDAMKSWDGSSKPLGLGHNGLILAKSASPHILISGMTGSGKTLYMMRTLATASLAQGSQVINVGYSDSGFGIFAHHPNYHAVALPKAERVIECLAQVYDELRQRKAMIGGDALEWEHWHDGQPPRPFLDLFIDELGNMAEDIFMQDGPARNKEMWSLVSRISNEGRKVGIRFVAALQDPTSKSMDLRFRRNCTLVSFRQGDRTQSDTFLGAQGAEHLQVGRFMARTDSLVVGGGFAPTDIQILEFLTSRKVIAEPTPKWVEALNQPRIGIAADEEPPLIVSTPERLPETVTDPVNEIAAMAERIRPQWTLFTSKTRTAKLLGFPQYGGSYVARTDAVIEYLTSTTPTATTTEKQPEMGSFASEMA